jgi:hypothetical protein
MSSVKSDNLITVPQNGNMDHRPIHNVKLCPSTVLFSLFLLFLNYLYIYNEIVMQYHTRSCDIGWTA